MTNRQSIMSDCPEEFQDQLKDYIDEVEGKVNTAKDLLENIKGASKICNVEESFLELERLATDLY